MKRLSFILNCMFPVIGVICIICPESVTKGLPYLLGGVMAVDGIVQIILCLKGKLSSDDYSDQLAHGFVLLIMGSAFLIQGSNSLGPMGITWAILGIRKASKSLSGAIRKMQQGNHFLAPITLFAVRITLALLLLFDPFEKFSTHIMILGMELIAVSIRFTSYRCSGGAAKTGLPKE